MTTSNSSTEKFLHFGPKHRKPKQPYKLNADRKTRRKTFAILRRIKSFCISELQNTQKTTSLYRDLTKVLLIIDGAINYLKKMKKISNIRLTRFSSYLSKEQQTALTERKIKTLIDISKLSKRQLCKILITGKNTPNISFLILLGQGKNILRINKCE